MKALQAVQCLRRRICRYLGGLRRGLVPMVFIEVGPHGLVAFEAPAADGDFGQPGTG